MSALTNAILAQHPAICGGARNPLDSIERVIIRGRATRPNDPLSRAGWKSTPILKDCAVANVGETVARWLAQGRTVDSIVERGW